MGKKSKQNKTKQNKNTLYSRITSQVGGFLTLKKDMKGKMTIKKLCQKI
jgi:hypothetical protein